MTVEEIKAWAESRIAAYEAQHASWREAFGERCAQPYESNIGELRDVVKLINGEEIFDAL